MTKLRQSARDCPYCMSCGLQNPNGDLLCLAHSNSLADGRGAYHKSPDEAGAIVCDRCHGEIDGRTGGLSKTEKRLMHARAHAKTSLWWAKNGYL